MTSRTTSALTAALVGRTVRTSLAVLAFTCGTTVATYAQTVPAPQAPASAPQASTTTIVTNPFTLDQSISPSAPITVAQAVPGTAPAAPPLGHLPIIDFVATISQPGVPFNNPIDKATGNQYHAYDPLDLGGTVRLPVTRYFYLAFDRFTEGTLNQAVERVINTNPVTHVASVIYPGVSRDIVLQYRGDLQLGKFVVVEAGDSFRHRLYANDGSGVSTVPFDCSATGKHTAGCTTSSTEHHYAYLGVTYTTPPLAALFKSTFAFNLTGDAQNVDHHVGTICSAANVTDHLFGCTIATQVGYIDENPSQNRVYETTQGVTWTIPVDIKHGVLVSARERWGALNFYENQPFPFRWATAFDAIISKRFSPGFTLALRHSDYHTVMMGTTGVNGLAPFATFLSPNAIHVASFDILGTFHVDTNSWLH